ncbi:uncharacterized protein PITG_16921 [Phytophthora infestans T30-4]|uniref:Uncharacterized protein n=1 Tax=Phytophthora infestans (strain T30-4) TaxID=403677 RepID=D0NUE5_PHYIT|nr:uncharacterized protein PITG_16921 [Phytophthora infestans T30-4]EEY65278.1 conserved hypothetical protein [Phytophthora infestans T30-4]|eukprot:XP_002897342.1 conserved hypothetical protein [Phytophthora infestans T30-4]
MQQERESAELCLNGCGFFGAPGSGGMCSVCWKKTMSDRQAASVASPRAAEQKVIEAAPLETLTAAIAEPADNNSAVLIEETAEKPAEKLEQKNKKRCWECKKKVGLTAIECRCGYVFCTSHRFEDQHSCSFDFKSADRAELARRNPGGGEFSKLEKLYQTRLKTKDEGERAGTAVSGGSALVDVILGRRLRISQRAERRGHRDSQKTA